MNNPWQEIEDAREADRAEREMRIEKTIANHKKAIGILLVTILGMLIVGCMGYNNLNRRISKVAIDLIVKEAGLQYRMNKIVHSPIQYR